MVSVTNNCAAGSHLSTSEVLASSVLPASAVSYGADESPAKLDPYGGLVTMPSANRPTGKFRLEKFPNKKWMFVDPDNNAFFMTGIYVLDQSESGDDLGSNYARRTAAKYGDAGPAWAPAQLRRIQSWNFNTVGPYASVYTLATHTYPTWPGDRGNPVKLPFVAFFRPSFYSMKNQHNWAPAPVKNVLAGASQYYTGYRPFDGVADYYDANWERFLANELSEDGAEIKKSPYKRYMIGLSLDDSDDLFGFGAGPDFTTEPEHGNNNPHLGWLVLTMSPVQTASEQYASVYSDTTVYAKKALHDQLVTKYGTISAINAAWGSNYTTFDSSGTTITREAIGGGDGSTLTFHKNLARPAITRFSLQILVGGTPAGGDLGNGTLWGPNLSGTVDYSTGALSVTLNTAPKNGAAIAANYVQNGWGIGSGLMDEDGRTSHQSWVGKDFVQMTDVNTSMKSDLDDFLYQIANHYFSTGRAKLQQWLPGTLFMGPSTLGTWSVPSNRNVLEAAAQSLDVMVIGGGWPLSQAELDFIYQNFGDKPIYAGAYRTANADSAFWRHPAGSGNFSTQADRGQDYYRATTALAAQAYLASGSRPYVGVVWWQYLDNWGEKLNWGLVSLSDNAYDGREAVTGRIPCSAPLQKYTCGGEERNYGDVVSGVKNSHQALFQLLQR